MSNKMFLAKIYNALCLVHVSGEDCIIMADCLKALNQYMQALEQDEQEKEE